MIEHPRAKALCDDGHQFKLAPTGYTTEDFLLNFDGVKLEWADKNRTYWNTLGDQTGSSFNVVNVEKTDAYSFSRASVIIDATFNCNFYTEDYPDSVLVVKNGLLKYRLENN